MKQRDKLKTKTIRSVRDFISALGAELLDDIIMFRGQGNANWPLQPSIARMYDKLDGYDNWNVFELDILEKFQKYSGPFLKKIPTNQVEWLIIAQHHGLPTRLLDWTTNPLKGLFFAVENPLHNYDGAVWLLEPDGWWTTPFEKERIDTFGLLAAYFPDHIDERVIAQESCFTFFPFPAENIAIPPIGQTNDYDKSIKKLIRFKIPRESKETIRVELSKLGITHLSIFPGLDGLATRIRREFKLGW